MNADKNMIISVLIVTYNNAATIRRCLDSLAGQTFRDFEILVRDNKSSDNTVELVQSCPDIKIFPGEKNIGFGAGMNYLAKKAGGEYLFLLNPDCECPENLLGELHKFNIAHGGALAPALEYPDGSRQESARKLPDYKSILFSRRSPLYQLGLAEAKDAGYLTPAEPRPVPAVSATTLFIARTPFLELGGFDERFFMYGEDLDLSKRLGDSDIPIWYLPTLKVKHILGASSNQVPIKSAYYHHLSIFKYFTKHFPHNYIKNSILIVLLTGGFMFSAITALLGRSRRR